MFNNIHHASYQVSDLDDSIKSYYETFDGHEKGRRTVPRLKEVAFVQVGNVEVEFIHPKGPNILRSITVPSVHDVAYAVKDLNKVVG